MKVFFFFLKMFVYVGMTLSTLVFAALLVLGIHAGQFDMAGTGFIAGLTTSTVLYLFVKSETTA